MFFPARSTGQWWVRVDGAALPILFPKKFRLLRVAETQFSVMVVPRSRPLGVDEVPVVTVTTTAARWSTQQSVVRAEEPPVTVTAPGRPVRRVRDSMAVPRRVSGIPAAGAERVVRAAGIRLTVDLACWFRFWVAIFTGAVAVEDLDIPVVAVTVELEVEVVERSIPLPAERV